MSSTILAGVPAASAIREELVDMVLRDLLGPAAGPDEEIDERRVRDRYLVGMLAPKHKELSPEEFDELAQGGTGTQEDGMTELTAPTTRTMFPSSFGMTFCVDPDASHLQITAEWGHYQRESSRTLLTKEGDQKLVWLRHRRGAVSRPIPLREGPLRWTPDIEFPEVQVQGMIRRRAQYWTVTVFLVNGQLEPKQLRDTAWLFQPEIAVESPDGARVFHSVTRQRDAGKADPVALAEEQEMAMLYRRHVEFAVGHGVSVRAERPEGIWDRAVRLSTVVVPHSEVLLTAPPNVGDFPRLDGLVLDMRALAETPSSGFEAALRPLITAYDAWIKDREAEAQTAELAPHRTAAERTIERCRIALARIETGLKLLQEDQTAAEAFRFANNAMWQQRVRTIFSLRRRRGEQLDIATIDVPLNRSWYPFQLAFILMSLPSLVRLDHVDRTGGAEAIADLLWYPTGGGKTEAYLGLAACAMAVRRLQGTLAGRSGMHGVAVLMRYTLRLLTIQQFQRAAALICACEMIRRSDQAKWGQEPFRIGLWVGQRTTPNTTDQAAEAIQQAHGQHFQSRLASGSPAQLTHCPWCGTPIVPGRDIAVETYQKGRCLTVTYCGDALGSCPFTARHAPGEGVPVLVVDEEIYRRLPALLIATVDKFAQMPWNGKVQMLFGQVEGRCERHGFRSPEIDDTDTHPKRAGLQTAKTVPHPLLRPPDLIIQDELHLISGPLGTLVGLYETAVDALCSWELGGKLVRPKVIASTATIRRAGDQIHATFLRRVNVFPPHGLDVRDSFFAVQRPPSEATPGRLYLGVCAPGRRLKAALIRVYIALLSGAQALYDRKGYGKAADPWMTLVGYFNSMRELGGMRRLVDDDVRTRLGKMDRRGLARRALYGVDELTSRKDSTDIPEVLDHLEVQFDPAIDSQRKALERKDGARDLPKRPIDVLLATNMVSVGVDVQRLGLMVVAGQPKATAEYIQATSRVGRRHPGLLVTVYNWTRPRDLSHYERFNHYHETFYQHVEALSVTPFALGAVSRGLTALLVSLVRLKGTEFNENKRAGKIERRHAYVKEAVEAIVNRAQQVGTKSQIDPLIRAELNERIDQWLAEAQKTAGGRILGYQDERDGVTVGLLRRPGIEPWDDFTCLNSLRDVEPTVGLVLNDGGLDDDASFVPAVSEDKDVDEEAV